jgi:hypothetical protein
MSLSLRPPIAWSFHGLDPQLDQTHSLRQPLFTDLQSLREKGIDFFVEIKGKRLQSHLATLEADVARREQPGSTLLADLASQTIALTLRSPITWDVHN